MLGGGSCLFVCRRVHCPGCPAGASHWSTARPLLCCCCLFCSVVQCRALLDIVMHRPWPPIGRGCADCCVVVVRRAAVARWALVELVYLSLVHFPLAASS